MKISQICVGKGNSLEEPAEQEIASRVVEFAKCQGALRACHVGADYEELKDSFVNSKKQSVRGLWWSALGQMLSGMGVQMLVAGMITFVSLLGLAGDMEALGTVVMIGVTLRFTTLLNDIVSSLFGMEDRRQMLNALRDFTTEDLFKQVSFVFQDGIFVMGGTGGDVMGPFRIVLCIIPAILLVSSKQLAKAVGYLGTDLADFVLWGVIEKFYGGDDVMGH